MRRRLSGESLPALSCHAAMPVHGLAPPGGEWASGVAFWGPKGRDRPTSPARVHSSRSFDVAVLAIVLSAVICVAWWASRRGAARVAGAAGAMSATTNQSDRTSAFFLAGRDAPWWIVAVSLFASNIGTEHFVGQARDECRR